MTPGVRSSDSNLVVSWTSPAGEQVARLNVAFGIGCDATGALQTDDDKIARAFAAVFRRDGQWWIRDLVAPVDSR